MLRELWFPCLIKIPRFSSILRKVLRTGGSNESWLARLTLTSPDTLPSGTDSNRCHYYYVLPEQTWVILLASSGNQQPEFEAAIRQSEARSPPVANFFSLE
jgi:hypothetical protein